MTILGVDLSANEKRASGVCALRDWKVRTWLLHTDEELVAWVKRVHPKVVAIDAPLSLPKAGRWRLCDRMLQQRGIRLFPPTMGAMRLLTERGMRLKAALQSIGVSVIEVFPGGAQEVLGLPRKQHGASALRYGLCQLGLQGVSEHATHDELDAITAAYVGWLWAKGLAESVGDPEEGTIVMPLPYPLRFLEGIRLYQRGYYWHAHEAWEEVWRTADDSVRPFLKGLIQIAAALIHAEREEWRGVLNLLSRVQRYLSACPEMVFGVPIREVQEQVAMFQKEAENLLHKRKGHFNWRVKPRINPQGLSAVAERLRRSPKDVPQRSGRR